MKVELQGISTDYNENNTETARTNKLLDSLKRINNKKSKNKEVPDNIIYKEIYNNSRKSISRNKDGNNIIAESDLVTNIQRDFADEK